MFYFVQTILRTSFVNISVSMKLYVIWITVCHHFHIAQLHSNSLTEHVAHFVNFSLIFSLLHFKVVVQPLMHFFQVSFVDFMFHVSFLLLLL